MQIQPHDLQQNEKARAEEKHPVKVPPAVRRRPVPAQNGSDADDRGELRDERRVRVALHGDNVVLLAARERLDAHARAYARSSQLWSRRGEAAVVELGDLLQVMQRDAVHPVQLQQHDEHAEHGEQDRQAVRVPVLVCLALPHPLADKVDAHRTHAQGHGEQAHEEGSVEQQEADCFGAAVHAAAMGVLYMYRVQYRVHYSTRCI